MYPTEYTFLHLDVPSQIRPYVSLTPSHHKSINISPMFYNLKVCFPAMFFHSSQRINPATIRDGSWGTFYYNLTLSPTILANLTGKLYDIKVSVNSSYFDSLPGPNDPTASKSAYHDYTLQIPPIKFGIPYQG